MPSISYYAFLGEFVVTWSSVWYWVTADADARGARASWLRGEVPPVGPTRRNGPRHD